VLSPAPNGYSSLDRPSVGAQRPGGRLKSFNQLDELNEVHIEFHIQVQLATDPVRQVKLHEAKTHLSRLVQFTSPPSGRRLWCGIRAASEGFSAEIASRWHRLGGLHAGRSLIRLEALPGRYCSAEVPEAADPAGGFRPWSAVAPAEVPRWARHQFADSCAVGQHLQQRLSPGRRHGQHQLKVLAAP